MEIFLVRHAKSDYDWDRWPTDDVRPLSKKGRERQTKVAEGMKNFGWEFEEVWVSPYIRARQTLEIILKTFSIKPLISVKDELVVWGDPKIVKRQLFEKAKDNPSLKLLIIGHNPNISSVVEELTNELVEMKTSDLFYIEINNDKVIRYKYYPRRVLAL
jgi:phosphohistidine phosphatase